ncbi:hypothetical protein [Noviherbaspirillum soli]|uniref:hypothetical protein n=1 Tax=Noviherbaspirillum soli TaxID=1064518 RepID=UPI00188A999A|nr:hypothetical protein [Noviherbaspirillum soli]
MAGNEPDACGRLSALAMHAREVARHRFERRAGDASSGFSLAALAGARMCRHVEQAIQTRYITMLVSDPLAAARAPHTKDS